ncbi:Cell division cycle protein 20 B [Liparis tanakae]|uniref:Cell division cycle protein 20 B n=1 Tax=Liparis tanakae TaxID=230148 RepID=A0A4Z2HL47_9TELE|nr:Cell division cycle protein 20 B [Liparis tanakae]
MFESGGPSEAQRVSYSRFRRRIIRKSGSEGPAASTPLATCRQREPSFDLDAVRQRLQLDSPPRHLEPARRGPRRETANAAHSFTVGRRTATEKSPEQGWVWRAAVQEHGGPQPDEKVNDTFHVLDVKRGSDEIRTARQPFALLDETSVNQRGESVMKLAAPSLLNDYYTNLLDCSCHGVIALALGSSVHLWDSETRSPAGSLDTSPQPGRPRHRTAAVSCLSWSPDGSALCVGTRGGEIQASALRSQSGGSALGHIHHLDPRAPAPLVGAVVQEDGVCGLQWSPKGDWLASGSPEGLLRIWGGGIAGVTRSRQPMVTMRQPSAVKAMGWCPWQRNIIATGGGWNDGELRVWDTDLGTCVTSAKTDSQICSLRWAEKNKCLVSGHGLPHHQVSCWSWDFPSLSPIRQLSGHSHRVLHLAVNPDGTQIFSAGADQRFHIWDA